MKIVCFVGKKRSGKDTATDYAVQNLSAVKYMLAEPIKEILALGWNFANMVEKTGLNLEFEDFDGAGFDREAPINVSNETILEYINICVRDVMMDILKYNISISAHNWSNVEKLILSNEDPWSIRRFMQLLGTDVCVDQIDKMIWMRKFAERYFSLYGKYDIFIISDIRQEHEISVMRSFGAKIIFINRDGLNSNDTHITEAGLTPLPNDIVIDNNSTLENFYSKLVEVL